MSLKLQTKKNHFSLFFIILCISLIFACKKKPVTGEANQEITNANQTQPQVQAQTSEEIIPASLFDFYSPALDDGQWVEDLLAHLEEERIAEELNSMEESLAEYEENAAPPVEEAPAENVEEKKISDVEKFFAEAKEGRILHGKNNELKFFEFDNEIFSPYIEDGKLVILHTNGNYTDRYFYDENYHLVKKENWIIPSVQAAKLEKSESYEYFADSSVVSKKTLTASDSLEQITYNNNAKILSSEKYALLENEKHILSKRQLVYDSEDKLLSDQLTDYYYKDKDYKELDYSFTKKYEYSANEGEIPPDFKYYENGHLRMLNKYSIEKGNYVSEVFFDDNFSVKSYYENDIRVKDLFYSDGKITREKIYEQGEQNEK